MVDGYMIACKEYRAKNVIPADASEKKDEHFLKLNSLALQIISEEGLLTFASMLYEGHYLIPLWTAHVIVENNLEDFLEESISVIKQYCDNPLAPEVAIREAAWLRNYQNA